MKVGLGLLALVLLSASCVRPYKPPTASQPHAIVKLRRSYDTTAGVTLREYVQIDENPLLQRSAAAAVASAPRADATLVHPVPGTFLFNSEFFHTESRMVRESYQAPRTVYEQESYDCSSGYGTKKTYRRCSRTVSRTRYETKYRYVHRQVQVTDGECTSAIRFSPQDGHVYLLQYTYHAHSVCSLSCFEQVQAQSAGSFKNLPCPAAPAESK